MLYAAAHGHLSQPLEFHLLRFPAIGDSTLGNALPHTVSFQHDYHAQNLSICTSLNYAAGVYGLFVRRSVPDEAGGEWKEGSSSVYTPRRNDALYGLGNTERLHACGAYWGSYDAVKVWFAHRQKLHNSLLIAAIFPQGVETWCQLINDPSVGLRKHFSSETFLVSLGAHTTLLDVLLSASVFKKFSDSTAFFMWADFGRTAADEFFVSAERKLSRCRARFSYHRRDHRTTSAFSTTWSVGKHTLVSYELRKVGPRFSAGVSVEWP